MQEPLWKVYSLYKYYFKLDYRFCRVALFVLIYRQGFHFFFAGYDYELINAGFSRNTMNTIDNIQNIVITLLVFLIGAKANHFGYKRSYMFELSLTLVACLYLWFFFPTDIVPVIILTFILGFFTTWNFLLNTIVSGDFPDKGVTGMIFTMSASAVNFGQNTFIHTAILKKVPWKTMSIIGLGIQIFLILFYVPFMINKIN
jgi:hypothetical protein